jgi:hypothetical protein
MKFPERRLLLIRIRRLGLVALVGAFCACQTGLKLSQDRTVAKRQLEVLIPLGTLRTEAETVLAKKGIKYTLEKHPFAEDGMERWPYYIQGSGFQLTLGVDDRVWGYNIQKGEGGYSVP